MLMIKVLPLFIIDKENKRQQLQIKKSLTPALTLIQQGSYFYDGANFLLKSLLSFCFIFES